MALSEANEIDKYLANISKEEKFKINSTLNRKNIEMH